VRSIGVVSCFRALASWVELSAQGLTAWPGYFLMLRVD